MKPYISGLHHSCIKTSLCLILILLPFVILHFKSGHFYLSHDGLYHLERTYNYIEAIREGDFPPSWTRFYNSGFGSPIFIFLFPVPYWISSSFYSLGIPLITAVKLTFLFFLLVGIVGQYFWLKKAHAFSEPAALASSLLLAFSPYTISSMFVRGSLREFAGAMIFPLLLYCLSLLSTSQNRKTLATCSIIISIFLLTDGVVVALFLLPLAIYLIYLTLISANRFRFFKHLFLSGLLGLLMAAFIYLPFVFEYQYLKPITNNMFQEHFIYPYQLIDPHWGFGFSMPGPGDQLSFQIGVINLLAIGVTLYFIITRKKFRNLLTISFIALLFFFIALMLQSTFAYRIWDTAPFLKIIQLPWRLLSPLVFIASFLAGQLINTYPKTSRKLFLSFYVVMIVVSIKYLRTNEIKVIESGYFENNTGDATAYHEFIPVWRDKTSAFEGFDKIEIATGSGTFTKPVIKNSSIQLETNFIESGRLRVNTLYFPGWMVTIDHLNKLSFPSQISAQPRNEKRDVSGVLEFDVPAGKHSVLVNFKDTYPRLIGKILTVIGIVITALLLFFPTLKRCQKNHFNARINVLKPQSKG